MKKYATDNNMFSIKLDISIDNVLAHKLYESNGFSYVRCNNLTNFDGHGFNDCVFYEYKMQFRSKTLF